MKLTRVIASAAVVMGLGITAAAAGDAEKGAKTFKRKCMACHTVAEGAPHRIGPNLNGVFGRAAAQADGYNYSKALKSKDITWSDENLDQWLTAPRKFIKGTKMVFKIRKAAEREDVIAYLKQNSE